MKSHVSLTDDCVACLHSNPVDAVWSIGLCLSGRLPVAWQLHIGLMRAGNTRKALYNSFAPPLHG